MRAALATSAAATRCIGEALGTNVSGPVTQTYASSATTTPWPGIHGLKRAAAEPIHCSTATCTVA